MTKEQEKRIFGDVLPDKLRTYSDLIEFSIQICLDDNIRQIYDGNIVLQIERQRREAIGMWLDTIMAHYKIGYIDNAVSRHLDIRHLFDKEIQWLESTLSKPWPQIKADWQGEREDER